MDVWEVPRSSCSGLDRGLLMDVGPDAGGGPFNHCPKRVQVFGQRRRPALVRSGRCRAGCRINDRPWFGSCVTSTSGPGSRGRLPSRCEDGADPQPASGTLAQAEHRRVFSPLIGKKNSRGHNSETFHGNECRLMVEPSATPQLTRVGPTSMRKALSRPEQDEHGTSQTSIRHHPRLRSAMSEYAVAPIHTGGVAMRHVGPRDAT